MRVWILDPLGFPYNLDLLLLSLICYFIRFGRKPLELMKLPKSSIIKILLLIYFFDFVQNLFEKPGLSFARIILMINIFIFLDYLYKSISTNSCMKRKPLDIICSPYENYSAYNVLFAIICALFIFGGILSPTSNKMSINSLIQHNIGEGGDYYFPGYMSVALGGERALADIGIPVLTGLSHEPHVLFLIIGPAFFLLLRRLSDSRIKTFSLYIMYLIMIIIATSVTATLVFLFTLLIEQIYSFLVKKEMASGILFIASIGVFILVIILYGGFVIEAMTLMIESKTEANYDNSSRDFSAELLKYMVTPKALFGSGNMPGVWGFGMSAANIGLITCVLDLYLYARLLFDVIKNVFSRNPVIHYIAMASFYFLLHIIKVGALVFNFVLLSFFVFLIYCLERKDYMFRENVR